MRIFLKKPLFLVPFFAFIFALGALTSLFVFKAGPFALHTSKEKDPYLEFTFEVYDQIKKNYWSEIGDGELISLYQQALEKITGLPQPLKENKRKYLEDKLNQVLKEPASADKKEELIVNLSDIVLANLKPFNRSRLYTQKDETDLKNKVSNINPDQNLYQILGVEKKADSLEIAQAAQKKTEELKTKQESDPQAKKALEEVAYAAEVLQNSIQRKIYDETGAQPTVFLKNLTSDIVYLKIKQLSPLTFEEFQKLANQVSGSPTSLILDLRGNIGGSIDILPYFLGPFIGANQYAYEFLHQGTITPFKTKTGWLPSLAKYKKVVVLIDQNTQSSAEVMASVLKKYNTGVLVGRKTKGWGTVEKIFPLTTKLPSGKTYSIFLVHSLTLREDSTPIEGQGVEPIINIDLPSWEKELFNYFSYQELIDKVKEISLRPET